MDTHVTTEKNFDGHISVVWRNFGNVPTDIPRFVDRSERLKKHMESINARSLSFVI